VTWFLGARLGACTECAGVRPSTWIRAGELARAPRPRPPHWRQDGPTAWDGETIERSHHGSTNDVRALFLPC
jgi:hypothetical protein